MSQEGPAASRAAHFLRRGYEGLVAQDLRSYLRKWIPLSILIGLFAGLAAMTFQWLLVGIWHVSYEVADLPWFLRLLIPAGGGLLAGTIMSRLSPESAGGGTDHVVDAIHHRGGYVEPRSGPYKIAVSALTIGSGGSGGQEGPIMHIGAAVASFFGKRMKLRRGDMRTFAIAGAAAGLSAVFRAPLGAAIYAIEVPYKNDVEPGAVIPSMMASVVSYLVFVSLNGYEPLFQVPAVGVDLGLLVVLSVVALGVVVGLAGRLFIFTMHGAERLAQRSRLPLAAKVMYGGLLVGCLGLFVPEALGLAEEEISALIQGSIVSIGVLLVLFLAKMLATSMTVGSGGSGGVFFPSLMMGGALGTAFALLLGLGPLPLFAIAGMGGMMSGVSKTPIAASVLMAEVVGGYAVLIPVMLASVTAYLVTWDRTLYRNQVSRRPFVYDPASLDEVPVEKVMKGEPVTLTFGTTVEQARASTADAPHYLYPVVDAEGRVRGVVLRDQLEGREERSALVENVMIRHFERVKAGTPAYKAFEDMNAKQISRMLVVGHDGETLLGTLTRIDLLEYLEHSDEEHRLY